MHTDIDTRVAEILDQYSTPHADVAWLLCDRHPVERVALTVIDERLNTTPFTYGDLADSSRRFAALLKAKGVRRGDRVAAVMGKSADLVTTLLGIWRVGAVYVPLFTAFAEEALRSRLVGAGVVLVVTDEDQLPKVPQGDWEILVAGTTRVDGLQDRKSTRLNSSHSTLSRMPSSA